jgi:hypothetical protein
MPDIQTVTYGGVTIPFAAVKYAGSAVYDSTGNVLQGYAIVFSVRAIVVSDTPANFTVALRQVLNILSHPRERFTWTVNGVVMFDVGASGTIGAQDTDRRFGPKPRVHGSPQITGGRSATVNFDVECFIYPCGSTLLDVEEFWWAFSYDFDRDFNCTRTCTGRYRLRSGTAVSAATQLLPNGQFWPKLPGNFYRDTTRHNTSADGSQIDFTVIDKQTWRTLPKPLTSGMASFRIEQRGVILYKTLNCSFGAPLDVDKQVIIQFILALARAKFTDAINTTKEVITSFSVQDNVFENRVEATITSQASIKSYDSAADSQSLIAQLFGDVADIAPAGGDSWTASNGQAELRGMLGTAGLVPGRSNPFVICGDPDPISLGVPGGSENYDSGYADDAPTRQTSTNASDLSGAGNPPQASLATEHINYPYVAFTDQWHFILDMNIVQLPVTIASTASVIQRTANPVLKVVQVGHARRYNKPPDVPQPPYIDDHTVDPKPTVSRNEVRPREPRVMADGYSLEYAVDWVRVVEVPAKRGFAQATGALPAGTTAIRTPINPAIEVGYYNTDVVKKVGNVQAAISADGTYAPNTQIVP